jgi:copper chaperone
MKTYKFKTNINCGGCVATIKPYLDKTEGIEAWEVDTTHKDKILSVKMTEDANAGQIQQAVSAAGFKAEPLHPGLFEKLFKK